MKEVGRRRTFYTPIGARRASKATGRMALEGKRSPEFDRRAGNCANRDPDEMFVEDGPSQRLLAKKVCRSCPVRYQCLADALDNRIEFGVWGGMSERQRRALLRRYPQISSWFKALKSYM